MAMSKGEKAELTIEPEWGYGKKGNIDAGYPLIKETDRELKDESFCDGENIMCNLSPDLL